MMSYLQNALTGGSLEGIFISYQFDYC